MNKNYRVYFRVIIFIITCNDPVIRRQIVRHQNREDTYFMVASDNLLMMVIVTGGPPAPGLPCLSSIRFVITRVIALGLKVGIYTILEIRLDAFLGCAICLLLYKYKCCRGQSFYYSLHFIETQIIFNDFQKRDNPTRNSKRLLHF